jgi:hypothetical protein
MTMAEARDVRSCARGGPPRPHRRHRVTALDTGWNVNERNARAHAAMRCVLPPGDRSDLWQSPRAPDASHTSAQRRGHARQLRPVTAIRCVRFWVRVKALWHLAVTTDDDTGRSRHRVPQHELMITRGDCGVPIACLWPPVSAKPPPYIAVQLIGELCICCVSRASAGHSLTRCNSPGCRVPALGETREGEARCQQRIPIRRGWPPTTGLPSRRNKGVLGKGQLPRLWRLQRTPRSGSPL